MAHLPTKREPRPRAERAIAGPVPALSQAVDAEASRDQPQRGGDRARRRARHRPPRATDECIACLADFAERLTDLAPLSSSVTRAWRRYRATGVDIDSSVRARYRARAVTREHQDGVRARQPGADRSASTPKRACFFAVLGDALGLREPSTSAP
jgi:hypothetical protein